MINAYLHSMCNGCQGWCFTFLSFLKKVIGNKLCLIIQKKTMKTIAQEHQARHFTTIYLKGGYKIIGFTLLVFVPFMFALFYQDDKFSGCPIRCLIPVGISLPKIILKYCLKS